MKRLTIAILIVISLVAGCAKTTRVKSGQATSVKSLPKRIVSLTPSNTEILFALGLENRIVGDTKYCDYPPEAVKKPKVGDMNVDMEKIISLEPDLVIANSVLNDEQIEKLKTLDVPVLATDPKTFSDVLSDIERIGKATGTKPQAERIVQGMKKTVEQSKKTRQNGKPTDVLVVVQTNPLWVAGPNTFVDEMIRFTNAKNIAFDAKPGFNTFSSEIAYSRDPEVIIVTRPEDKDYFMKNNIWKKTKAVRSNRVVVISADLIFRPGPRLAEGLKLMTSAIYH
jgi:iron complex transport system substrate-binding protein